LANVAGGLSRRDPPTAAATTVMTRNAASGAN